MTVLSNEPVNNFIGDGNATRFDFDFLIEKEEELYVVLTDSLGTHRELILNKDYSIAEVGNPKGSFIVFPIDDSDYPVLQPDEKISLQLNLKIEQTKQFSNSSKLDLTMLEKTFDYVVRVLQIFNRKIARCIKIYEGDTQTVDEFLNDLNRSQINSKNSEIAAQNAAKMADEYRTEVSQLHSDINDIYVQERETLAKFIETSNTVMAELENKANVDLANCEISEAFKTLLKNAGIVYVVEKYQGNDGWYRVWSDGWIEQGGVSSGVATVAFKKKFANTNYSINVTRLSMSENIPAVTSRTIANFTVGWKVVNQNANAGSTSCSWRACGY